MGSELPGFHALALERRRRTVAQLTELSDSELRVLAGVAGFGCEQADTMVENAVGILGLPLSVCTNMRVNGADRLIPMAIEEASVVAAASFAAKLLRAGGGVHVRTTPAHMVGQIQVLDVDDPEAAEQRVAQAREEILHTANLRHPHLAASGGGACDVSVRHLMPTGSHDPLGPMLVVHLLVDVREAMGANIVNSMCEDVAPSVARCTGGRVRLRIVSNLSDQRLAHATGTVPLEALENRGLSSAEELGRAIEEASVFAERDPYRAATHNKGIMNGVDAVLIALGQDWRAIEAGAHAFAARGGRYTALARWRLRPTGLEGELALPMAVGVIGGVMQCHPTVQIAFKIAGVTSAADLAGLVAAVGLAQNLGALRALAAEGIQHGHMRLHHRKRMLSVASRAV